MNKQDLFNYSAIPVMVIITLLAFIAAYFGWV